MVWVVFSPESCDDFSCPKVYQALCRRVGFNSLWHKRVLNKKTSATFGCRGLGKFVEGRRLALLAASILRKLCFEALHRHELMTWVLDAFEI